MQFFGGSEISPSPPVPTAASGDNAHMMYVFNRNGVCLLYREWNRPLHTLNAQQDQKLMFGLLFSLMSLTAKLDPTARYVCIYMCIYIYMFFASFLRIANFDMNSRVNVLVQNRLMFRGTRFRFVGCCIWFFAKCWFFEFYHMNNCFVRILELCMIENLFLMWRSDVVQMK